MPGAREVVFSAHCHNDLGLAVANSLAAIEGGARQVECTINGIGERAGNCALEELVMALKVRGAYFERRHRHRHPPPACRPRSLLSRLIGMPVQRNKAVVGANAFAHESGIHQHGMLRHRGTYEIMRPEDVGWPESQHGAGPPQRPRRGLRTACARWAIVLEEAQLDRVFADFKALCEKQRVVDDDDLEALMSGSDTDNGRRGDGFRLASMTGQRPRPPRQRRACELSDPDGDRVVEARAGRWSGGRAVRRAGARPPTSRCELESYQVHSVGIGADARGEANLSVRHGERAFEGTGTSRDIIEASALAWLDVANRVLRTRAAQRRGDGGMSALSAHPVRQALGRARRRSPRPRPRPRCCTSTCT